MSAKPNFVKRATRAAAIGAARLILRPRERPLPPPRDVHKILLVKMWALGEYVMATPAFAALRELYAGAEVTFMTGLAARALAADAPFFDRVWTVPEEVFVRRRLAALRRLHRRVAHEGFDLAVVFHHAWEFSLFAAATRIPHRIGLDRDGDGFAYTVKVPGAPHTHQVIEYFELARACGAPGKPGPLAVAAGEEAAREAEHLWGEVPSRSRRAIIMAPGGGVNAKTHMEDKRWPAASYAELAKTLAADYDVVLVGDEADRATNAAVAHASRATDLSGKTSLAALYLLMKKAAAFVGNDSAPMHLAAAAQTPTVTFFGPTDVARYGPWRTRTLIIQNATPCRPCYRDGYFPHCDDRRCLTAITPGEASSRIYEFLDSVGDR